MLDDFPLLLDIRSCQVAEASCYLSELFAGYEGRGDTLCRGGVSGSLAIVEPAGLVDAIGRWKSCITHACE